MPSFPVSQPVGTRVYGPFNIPNNQSSAVVKFTKWGATATVLDMKVEVSFDAGGTWKTIVDAHGFTGGGSGRFGDPSVSMGPIGLLCGICGNEYLPGVAAFNRSLVHSTVTLNAGVTLQQIADAVGYPVNSIADIQLRILVTADGRDVDSVYVTRTFHNPVLDQNAPLRQMRITGTVTGATLNTTLDVTLGV